ncbi:hypothetical protein LTR47_000292 [Exophiala xenobiotica]|nr:hypothetical protein LTR47_000292 [Exophiala xenobiotica]KAK5241789.1 hypothetical protein LTS06_011918 [Exophiala xenobiotica]KAK5325537.1 hypothetical protein LTR93_003757 [Exophiala xenobiotica]KAK5349726.1 hypothetical protein LTR61_006432 [Exophiala xenobiotica]KAK5387356.1 hypothetical protein LTR11_001021 [Exophiala xenobiotica]
MLVQAALGFSESRALLLGGLIGGIAHVKWNQRHKQLTTTDKSTKHSMSETTGLRDSHTMLALEAALPSLIFTNAFRHGVEPICFISWLVAF